MVAFDLPHEAGGDPLVQASLDSPDEVVVCLQDEVVCDPLDLVVVDPLDQSVVEPLCLVADDPPDYPAGALSDCLWPHLQYNTFFLLKKL